MIELDYLEFWIDKGIAVHPLLPNSKVPIASGWQEKATLDLDTAIYLFDGVTEYNLGGYLSQGNILVVDVDNKGSKIGNTSINYFLKSDLMIWGETLTVKTPSDGYHMYYSIPVGAVKKDIIGWLPGIDILVNRNIVLPPSKIEEKEYSIIFPEPIADCPNWLIELLNLKDFGSSLQDTAGSGERNKAVNSHLYKLWTNYPELSPDCVLASGLAVALNSTEPPYSAKEVQSVFNSISQNPRESTELNSGVDTGNFQIKDFTDTSAVEYLSHYTAGNLRVSPVTKSWFYWSNNHIWDTDMNESIPYTIITEISEKLSTLAKQLSMIANRGEDKEEKATAQKLKKWAERMRMNTGVTAILGLARKHKALTVDITDFDNKPHLIAFRNGVFDLNTREFREGEKEDFLTISVPYNYNPTAKCPTWDKFILEIMGGDVNLAGYLKRVLGYSITGYTKEQKLFILEGTGANGKSTLLNALHHILGGYSGVTDFNTFKAGDRGSSISADLAGLRAVRMVTVAETEEFSYLNESRVKAVTAGDPLSVRKLYQDFFTLYPVFKVFMAVNTRFRVVGTDNGIWRRIELIPFNVSFNENADRELPDKLIEEGEGILQWLLEGAIEWLENGLNTPDTILQEIQGYRNEEDTLGGFLSDTVTFNTEEYTEVAVLYKYYTEWCSENGHKPLASNTFSKRIKARGIEQGRKNLQRAWKNMKVIQSEEDIVKNSGIAFNFD